MTDNLKYGLLLAIAVIFIIAFVVYIGARQDECAAKGGTLVRVPLGIGWNCVRTSEPN